ncbi:hypothetical protein K1719_033555 [Acacia pycnantha]|nr:hypothetical protein K1719_033555 [Acacia pycnantha]
MKKQADEADDEVDADYNGQHADVDDNGQHLDSDDEGEEGDGDHHDDGESGYDDDKAPGTPIHIDESDGGSPIGEGRTKGEQSIVPYQVHQQYAPRRILIQIDDEDLTREQLQTLGRRSCVQNAYEGYAKGGPSYNIGDCDLIMGPILVKEHWFCVALDPSTMSFYVLDSMNNKVYTSKKKQTAFVNPSQQR